MPNRRHSELNEPEQEKGKHSGSLYDSHDNSGRNSEEEDERFLLEVKTTDTTPNRYLFDESRDDDAYDAMSITSKQERQHDDEGHGHDKTDSGAFDSTRTTRNRLTASERSASKRRKKFYKEIISIILPMILLSLVGSTLAGEIVDSLKVRDDSHMIPPLFTHDSNLFATQFWEVFQVVPELFILVPIMLNLKGVCVCVCAC